MTNGEKLKEIFPNIEVKLDDKTEIMIVKWADNTTKFFKTIWWNAEYKEPITKNDLGVDWDELKRKIFMEVDGGTDDKWLTYADVCDNISNSIDDFKADLSSVTLQAPRKGHWIKGYTFPDGAYWKCDKCNELIKVKIPMHYCNNCGADMREVEDDNN